MLDFWAFCSTYVINICWVFGPFILFMSYLFELQGFYMLNETVFKDFMKVCEIVALK